MNTSTGFRSAALVVCAACSLFGCGAGVQQFRETVQRDIAELRSIQAKQAAQLDEMREDVRRLTGQVEESQHLAVGKTKELEHRLSTLGSRVPPPEGVPADLLAQDEQRISTMTGEAADSFRAALQMLREGNFVEAGRSFDAFAQANTGTAFTDNAFFWSGICSERLGRDDQAIVSYSNVFQQYPGEDRVPAALYYLGRLFERAGSKQEATVTFQKLIEEFPGSEYASQARSVLTAMGKSAPGASRSGSKKGGRR